MKLYKIVFAEFEKFKGDDDYSCSSFGTTQRIYKTEKECLKGILDEYKYLERVYPELKNLGSDSYEFRVSCFAPNNRKETLFHYRMVEFYT